MIRTAGADPHQVIYGSALRRAWRLVDAGLLHYDPDREAGLNDLVFGELLPPPAGTLWTTNWLERAWPAGPSVAEIEMAPLSSGPCIGVVGNRYAAPWLIGGLFHPITGLRNGVIRGGVEVDSLFGVNCLGFFNSGPEPRARVKVLGTLVDETGRSLSLLDFREPWTRGRDLPPAAPLFAPGPEDDRSRQCRQIVVAGHATDSGKTTCARALIRALRRRGFRVTVEKKTGTACCRDWLSCLLDRRLDPPAQPGVPPFRTTLELDGPDGRDFVDALGVASDVSLPPSRFARESAAYTVHHLRRLESDFHVVELADGISHVSNLALLSQPAFAGRIAALVYCSLPSPEAVSHFLSFSSHLGLPRGTPVLLSGPLANEGRFELARLEVQQRWHVAALPSADMVDGSWEPTGESLAAALLGLLGARAPEPSGPAATGTAGEPAA